MDQFIGYAEKTPAIIRANGNSQPPNEEKVSPIVHSGFYQAKLQAIAELVSPGTLQSWFVPLNAIETLGGVKIIALDETFADWITQNYAHILSAVGLAAYEWEFIQD